MQVVKITLEFKLADLVARNEMMIPANIALANHQFDPPPPPNPCIERIRREFQQIEPYLSGLSLEIMQCLLEHPMGQARREDLECLWKEHPTYGAVRQASRRLNDTLNSLKFDYVIRGSHGGIFRLILISK